MNNEIIQQIKSEFGINVNIENVKKIEDINDFKEKIKNEKLSIKETNKKFEDEYDKLTEEQIDYNSKFEPIKPFLSFISKIGGYKCPLCRNKLNERKSNVYGWKSILNCPQCGYKCAYDTYDLELSK